MNTVELKKCAVILTIMMAFSVIVQLQWSNPSRICVGVSIDPELDQNISISNNTNHTRESMHSIMAIEQIEWNNLQTIKRKLSHFSNGEILYIPNKEHRRDAKWSVTVPPVSNTDMQRCFGNKWIFFFGDSRLRYSYAEWIQMVNGTVEDPYFPQNAPCPALWNREQCAIWYKGRECEYSDCLRDWHLFSRISAYSGISGPTGRWTFNSMLIRTGFTSLVTNSQKPDLIFVNQGAWAIYDVLYEQHRAGNVSDYLSILEEAKVAIKFVEDQLESPDVIKIWMSYPECVGFGQSVRSESRGINDLVERYIQQHTDWIFFRLPTPDIPMYCEGFHVRNQWTKLENEIITNVLCDL